MGQVPDHTPTAATAEHAAVIAALDAGDLAGPARDRAVRLAESCTGCASLLADLALIRAATAALPAGPRTRDYRLTDADAARLRPSVWRRLIGWLAAPRSAVRPLAGGLAALGIAGLLLSTTPGFFGQVASTSSTTAAPVSAPGTVENAAGAAASDAASGTAPITLTGPAESPTIEPKAASAPAAASSPGPRSAPGGPGANPSPAALPAPSLAALPAPSLAALPAASGAAAALPVPTAVPTEIAPFGPSTVATPGSAGFSSNGGANDAASNAIPPDASQRDRNANLAAGSSRATTTSDRTVPVTVSLALLLAGIALFVTNRLLRRRAGA